MCKKSAEKTGRKSNLLYICRLKTLVIFQNSMEYISTNIRSVLAVCIYLWPSRLNILPFVYSIPGSIADGGNISFLVPVCGCVDGTLKLPLEPSSLYQTVNGYHV